MKTINHDNRPQQSTTTTINHDNQPSQQSTTRTQGEPPIVPFGGLAAPQKEPNREIVGGKGLGLQEMTRIGKSFPGRS